LEFVLPGIDQEPIAADKEPPAPPNEELPDKAEEEAFSIPILQCQSKVCIYTIILITCLIFNCFVSCRLGSKD
jgi:hypothetical protein